MTNKKSLLMINLNRCGMKRPWIILMQDPTIFLEVFGEKNTITSDRSMKLTINFNLVLRK